LVLKQILAVVAKVDQKMEEKARKVEEALEAAVARWDARLVEGLSAVLGEVGEREERMVARLCTDAGEREARQLADAKEREKRLEVRLLALDEIETEQVQKAKWDLKQCEDLAVMMRARREELGEVKRGVEGIAAEIAGMRALGGPPTLAAANVQAVAPAAPTRQRPTAPVEHSTPQPMEGVMTTASPAACVLQEDPIEEFSDMEGVERDGLFASRHAPALSSPTSVSSSGTPAPLDYGPVPAPAREALVEKEKKTRKDKGKGKAVQLVAPPTLACKPKGSVQQQRRQAEVDKNRAEAARTGLKVEAVVPSAPAPVRSILKRPETIAAEKAEKEAREREKAAARKRWVRGDFSKQEEESYTQAARPLWGLGNTDEEEEATQKVAHLAGMRAVEDHWEQEWESNAARASPQQQKQQQRQQYPNQQPMQQQHQQRAPQQQASNWAQRAAAAAALLQTGSDGFNQVGRGGKVTKETTGLEPIKRSIPWDEWAILFERAVGAPQIDAAVAASAAAQVNIALSKVAPPHVRTEAFKIFAQGRITTMARVGASAAMLLHFKKEIIEAAQRADKAIINVVANETWAELKILVPYAQYRHYSGLTDLRKRIEAENEGVVIPLFSMQWMRTKKIIEQHF